jgi:hypothetical protein
MSARFIPVDPTSFHNRVLAKLQELMTHTAKDTEAENYGDACLALQFKGPTGQIDLIKTAFHLKAAGLLECDLNPGSENIFDLADNMIVSRSRKGIEMQLTLPEKPEDEIMAGLDAAIVSARSSGKAGELWAAKIKAANLDHGLS